MVLTKDELIQSLQNEVRIFGHLMSKIDPAHLDYRPTAKQRSTLEVLQYLVRMGPALVKSIHAGAFDAPAWAAAEAETNAMNFDQVKAAIAKQGPWYAEHIGAMSEGDLRGEVEMLGRKGSRGLILVELVLCGFAAYRTQLFCYLKACGREELSTWDLWAGMDAPAKR